MAKKSRTRPETPGSAAAASGEGQVGPRQPCPCGSGKRYKNCHGGADGGATAYVARPFAGLTMECDLVALKELVPAATAPLTLRDDVENPEGRAVRLCTLLPGATPALVREDGTVWLGLQVQHAYGDPSRDLAAVLERALAAPAGEAVVVTTGPGAGPRLQDLVVDEPLDVTVHDGFGFWADDLDEETRAAMGEALSQADSAAVPTVRLDGLGAAYWCDVSTKEHLRWVRPEPEDRLLDALARLHAADASRLTDDSRLVGMFRSHGVLCPVWDLEVGTGADAVQGPAERFDAALTDALAATGSLSSAERAARNGLANRQVTIR
ncbi:DUF5926 family protein [Nocardioides sp. CFH 31398]|uniref:DUF5926 family protein n=1 Tax=Nocardioides sp. CFH 31398 TaxID=2919579 RepID=UPI001F05F15B|nr:DUF5926 family protein [Nocardioides sp. CFH 31398]MCH1865593.1 DUF5926 family protein [Nocardioides sp. CFH 31398]